MAVEHQPQVREGVFNFQPLVESLATVDTVGDIRLQQCRFQYPGLGIGAVENSGLLSAITLLNPTLQAIGNIARLIVLIKSGIEGDGFTLTGIGPEVFAEAFGIAGNNRVGGTQNIGGGAIILLQLNRLGVGKMSFKTEDILHLGSAPTIDGLVVITHSSDAADISCQQP